MSNTNNNGFIAAIVEQTGGGGKAQLSNDAPTIVEKYMKPTAKDNDRMATAEEMMEEGPEEEKTDLCTGDMPCPTLWLDDKQLPSANGLAVGDKVCIEIEAEVSNYEFTENIDGLKRQNYTFKLKKAFVKKED